MFRFFKQMIGEKKYRVLVLIVIGAVVAFQVYTPATAMRKDSASAQPELEQKVSFERQGLIRAWVPWTHFDDAVEQIRGPQKLRVDEAVMYGYVLHADGSVEDYLAGKSDNMKQLADEGIRLIAGVYNERDGQRVTRILSDAAVRQGHIDDLVAIAKTEYFSGIEIDYERLLAKDRQLYTQFVKELTEALHLEGKTLAVTVHAKTTDDGPWHGTAAQDWREIGSAADWLIVLAYDYSWETSMPGPLAPTTWVKDVVNYALSQVASDRIVIGVPAFGYDWNPHVVPALNYSLMEIEDIIVETGVQVVRDETTDKPHFSFRDEHDCPHDIWYEDAKSMQLTVDLVKESNLRGVSIWAFGGVTTSFFTAFSDQL